MIKRTVHVLIGLSLSFLTAITPAYALNEMPPFAETEDVYQNLIINHLNKPTEQQLVQGALKKVSEQAEKTKKAKLAVSAEDNTLQELESRLQQWQTTAKLDWKLVNQWAIAGMLSTLNDPHTMFFSKDELRRFQAGVENQFVGFGFRLRKQGDQLQIREIIPNSPASASELRQGDQLIAVDGIKFAGKSLDEAINLIRGEEGTEAVLTVFRSAEKQEKKLTLKRAFLSIPEAEGGPFSDQIGYISLETFGSDAAYQVRDLLAKFSQAKQPLKGLILDLRDNGGGYLSSARDIASLFFEDGLLMYTTNRNGVEIETWVHNGRSIAYPIRILVNENTASASELLSGALRDHDLAKLVGTKTYGKGSAQQIVPLLDGDALKITLHEYFTPNHTVVNHVGLTPDVAADDYFAQVIEALKSLGVKKFELRESGDDVEINGVAFPALEQLFKSQPDGLAMPNGVLNSLLGEGTIADGKGYSLIKPFADKNRYMTVKKTNTETILTITLP